MLKENAQLLSLLPACYSHQHHHHLLSLFSTTLCVNCECVCVCVFVCVCVNVLIYASVFLTNLHVVKEVNGFVDPI